MVVAFGFSIGDFIAAISLAKQFIDALKARGGAVDSYHQLLGRLEADSRALQYFSSLNLPSDFADLENVIVDQANTLHASSTQFLSAIDQYGPDLKKKGAHKFHRVILAKTKWFLSIQKKLDGYKSDIEVQRARLRLLIDKLQTEMLKHGLNIQHRLLSRLDDQDATSRTSEAQQRDMLQDLNSSVQATLSSIRKVEHNIQKYINTATQSHVDLIQTYQTSLPRPAISPPSKLPGDHSGLESTFVPSQREDVHAHESLRITTNTASVADNQVSSQAVISSVAGASGRAGPTTIYQDHKPDLVKTKFDRPFVVKPEGFDDVARELAYGLLQVMKDCSGLYAQALALLYLIWIKLRQLPRSVSLLLSENIFLEDFLGRLHNLRRCDFEDWSVVQAMLEYRFRNCPGLDRIKSKAFVLEFQVGENKLDRLRLEDWQLVGPRAKVVMSASLWRVTTTEGQCPWCSKTTSSAGSGFWTCLDCSKTFRASAWNTAVEDFADIQAEKHRSHQLDLKLTEKIHGEMRQVLKPFLDALFAIYEKLQLLRSKSVPDGKDSAQREHLRKTQAQSDFPVVGYDDEQIYLPQGGPSPGFEEKAEMPQDSNATKQSWSESKAAELRDLQIFRHMSLRIQGQIHNAASEGNAVALGSLLRAHFDPARDTGSFDDPLDDGLYGNPLVAAIFSNSVETVHLLLDYGADPFTITNISGHTPLEIAACRGNLETTWLLLNLSWRSLDRLYRHGIPPWGRKIPFDALGSALRLATRAGQLDAVRLLLFHGADPFYAEQTSIPCAFDDAFVKGQYEVVEMFKANGVHRLRNFQKNFGKSLSSPHNIFQRVVAPNSGSIIVVTCYGATGRYLQHHEPM